MQVKHARSNGAVIPVPTRSLSLTNGKVKAYKLYTAEMIDWLAVYDPVTDRCYYIPASVLGSGMTMLHLRLSDTRNNQRIGVLFASDYVDF